MNPLRSIVVRFCLTISLGISLSAVVKAADEVTHSVEFVADIRPIFKAHCYECHGPDEREAGLRLDRKEPALAGGDSGAVIVPGEPDESLLVSLVLGEDADRAMPPTGETLSADQIELLRRWIEEGANWPDGIDGEEARPDHWAYQPLLRHEPPVVSGSSLVTNAVDAFVQTRLQDQGIEPSPAADRYTLIKRLHYDLIGLPPTIEAVDAFVNDPNPAAYDHLVDELLDSPHFGERWGRHWLDKARYADSDGYEKDRPRYHAWKYRDWVINAINDDLPFDRFTIEQLAGDLLEDATHGQLVATGFNRQTLTNTEGGTDKEEFRCEAIFDRIETLGSVWLGLTVGCARCHSHKYDRISQREYYELFAFFNNADETNTSLPTSAALMEEYRAKHDVWQARLTELQARLNKRRTELKPDFESWLAETSAQLKSAQDDNLIQPSEARTESDTVLTRQPDGSWLASGERPQFDVYTANLSLPPEPESGSQTSIAAVRLDVLTDSSLPAKGPGRADNGNFVLSEITIDVAAGDGKSQPRRVGFSSATADHSQKGYDVAKAIDGTEDVKGWAIGGGTGKPHWAVFTLEGPIHTTAVAQTVTIRLSQQYELKGQTPHLVGRFKLTLLSPEQLRLQEVPDEIRKILADVADQRDGKQRQALFDHFASRDGDFQRLKAAVDNHKKSEPFKPEFPVALINERTTERRETKVFRRGSFLEPLGAVSPRTFDVLPRMPKPDGREPNRLDLAHWLVSGDNPLTPRVVVNQFWGHLFGQGLVKTVNDFGVRGEPPSHPALLDWLASEFIRLGWSRKKLLRTILLSHTYRQSSVHRPELSSLDPENRLLARQDRFRVEAEIVRDLYLAASGLLEPRVGGPSVFPRIPPGIAELSYANNFKWGASDWNSRPDNPHGVPPKDDIYRRGLYTFFKRTAAHPNLVTFDCPDANTSCVARRVSNTPLQALQTLNNAIFLEASQALAAEALEVSDVDDAGRITWLFRRCVARPPEPHELSALASLLADARTSFDGDETRATEFCGERRVDEVSAVELASWVVLSRVVLNLDEFLTRE